MRRGCDTCALADSCDLDCAGWREGEAARAEREAQEERRADERREAVG